MGHSSEASGSYIQLKRQRAIMSARLIYISFQQVRAYSCLEQFAVAADSWRVPTSQVEICRDRYTVGADVKVKGLKAEILPLKLPPQE